MTAADVIALVLSGLAFVTSVASVVYTRREANAARDSLRLERTRQEIEEHERRRAQAAEVTFDFDWPRTHDDATVTVTNASGRPIRDCRLFCWRHDSMGHELIGHPAPTIAALPIRGADPSFTVKKSGDGLGDIQPGCSAKARVMTLEPHTVGEVVALVFIDAGGRQWRIWHDGTIEDLTDSGLAPERRAPATVGQHEAVQPRRD